MQGTDCTDQIAPGFIGQLMVLEARLFNGIQMSTAYHGLGNLVERNLKDMSVIFIHTTLTTIQAQIFKFAPSKTDWAASCYCNVKEARNVSQDGWGRT